LLKDIKLLKVHGELLDLFYVTMDKALVKVSILPLMYVHEIADILIFIESLKQPSDKFNILIMLALPLALPDLLALSFTQRQPHRFNYNRTVSISGSY